MTRSRDRTTSQAVGLRRFALRAAVALFGVHVAWLLGRDAVVVELESLYPRVFTAVTSAVVVGLLIYLLVLHVGTTVGVAPGEGKATAESAPPQPRPEPSHAARPPVPADPDGDDHFRGVVENASDMAALLDPEGRVLYVNPSVQCNLDYGPAGVVGRDIITLLHPDDRWKALRAFVPAIRTGRPFCLELRVRHRDGSWRRVDIAGRRHIARDGGVQIVTIARDMTDRRALEEQVRRAQKMEAIGRLAGAIAHDFNNVMTVVSGYTEILLAKRAAEDDAEAELLEVRSAVDRASALTEQLLAYSRQQVLQPKVFDLGRLVADMETMLRKVTPENIEHTVLVGREDARVKADPTQLQQVLMNLVINAQDAMPDGGRLTIEVRSANLRAADVIRFPDPVEPGPYVCLAVRDTGHGMDEETQAQVFEPFYTTKKQGEGTGLGLSTAYGIVKQSGGCIAVESSEGAGTVFDVYLPRVDDPLDADPEPTPVGGVPGGDETLLVVEDDPAVRRLITRVLGDGGYTVVEAGNGREALRDVVSAAGSIDLIVSDVVMPKMGGLELVEQLADEHPTVPALLMSGYSPGGITDTDVLRSGDIYLPKPVKPNELLQTVRGLLDDSARGSA